MCTKSNNLSIINDPLAISKLSLHEKDFIEAEKAILGSTATVLYTIIVACCIAIIGIYGISAQLGFDFLPSKILFVPFICLPTASVYYFVFPKWIGILRYRQYETVNNPQYNIAFLMDHFEIRVNNVNAGSYLYASVRRILISENLYIIVLPHMVVLPIRHVAISEEKWSVIQRCINTAMAAGKEQTHRKNTDITEDQNRFTGLMCFVLVILLCSLLPIHFENKKGDTSIGKADFELKNDGCGICKNCWKGAWQESQAEVILSGEEQFGEQNFLYFDGTLHRKSLTGETEPATTRPEIAIQNLDINVMENRKNELVFDISIDEFIGSYNSYWIPDHGCTYLSPSSEWKWYLYDTAIHSDYETFYVCFTEDDRIYPQSTVSVYVPSNKKYVQELTINFDEHSYSESGYEQYKQMCFYTLKVFFPDLTDETILNLCTETITLGNQHVFTSEEWYSSDSVPYVLFHKDGIGVYPYFAIGDWERFCIIPVTLEIIRDFEQKGVKVYEIE